jgi:glycerol uptake facilitator-like aquaporin
MLNPAVVLAVWLRRKIPGGVVAEEDAFSTYTAVIYAIVQVCAAFSAGGAALFVFADTFAETISFPQPVEGIGFGRVVFGEMLAVAFLIFVGLNSATSAKTAGNSFYGLAVGFTAGAMVVTFGPITGGALNPAVGLLSVVGAWTSDAKAEYVLAYWVGPLLGAAVAVLLFRLQNFDEFERTEESIEKTRRAQKFNALFEHEGDDDEGAAFFGSSERALSSEHIRRSMMKEHPGIRPHLGNGAGRITSTARAKLRFTEFRDSTATETETEMTNRHTFDAGFRGKFSAAQPPVNK